MTVAPHSTANWIAAWPTAPEPRVHEQRVAAADGERAQRLIGGADRDAERGALGGADLRRPRRARARRATTTSVAYAPDAPKNDDGVAGAEAVDARRRRR